MKNERSKIIKKSWNERIEIKQNIKIEFLSPNIPEVDVYESLTEESLLNKISNAMGKIDGQTLLSEIMKLMINVQK